MNERKYYYNKATDEYAYREIGKRYELAEDSDENPVYLLTEPDYMTASEIEEAHVNEIDVGWEEIPLN